jgi:hypothetical protein
MSRSDYLKNLSEEHESIAMHTRKEWMNMFFDNVKEGRGIDKPAFEKSIEWIYCNKLKREKPKFVYCDSFITFYITFGILSIKKSKVSEEFSNFVMHTNIYDYRDAIKDFYISVDQRTRMYMKFMMGEYGQSVIYFNDVCFTFPMDLTIRESILKFHYDSRKNLIEDSLWNSIHTSCTSAIDNSTPQSVLYFLDNIKQCTSNHFWKFIQNHIWIRLTDNLLYRRGINDFKDFFCYDYFNKLGIIKSDSIEKLLAIGKSCALEYFTYENYVFAIQPPVYISRNEDGRLHSTEGPAVKFRDGSCQYFINGRYVPAWIFKRKDEITRSRFLREKNSETRAGIYAVLGQKRMMEMLGAETVHTSEIRHANGDVERVELLKTREKFPETGDEPFAWVKVTCPSTGTNYLLGVEPKHTNAAEAIASLSMFDAGEYSFNFRT